MPNRMLSIDRCRRLLGADQELDDSQIEVLRNEFYSLAELMLDEIARKTQPDSWTTDERPERSHDIECEPN